MAFEGLNQPDRGNQRGVVLRVDGVVDDVLGREPGAPPTMTCAQGAAKRAFTATAGVNEARRWYLLF